MYRYVLVRENSEENQLFDSLASAREAMASIPDGESCGIIRVADTFSLSKDPALQVGHSLANDEGLFLDVR